MASKQNAFVTAALGIGAAALIMVTFYYVKDRRRVPEGGEEVVAGEKVDLTSGAQSEFAGLYAATDGAMEGGGFRIASFSVANTDGVLQGSVRLDAVGASDTFNVACQEVRVDGKEFFVKCQDAAQGMISLNGVWSKDAGGVVNVAGKVTWIKGSELLIDQSRNFQLLKN